MCVCVCVCVYMCARMGTGESGRSCDSETECENFSLYQQREFLRNDFIDLF